LHTIPTVLLYIIVAAAAAAAASLECTYCKTTQ
jgi:hypothetical protein